MSRASAVARDTALRSFIYACALAPARPCGCAAVGRLLEDIADSDEAQSSVLRNRLSLQAWAHLDPLQLDARFSRLRDNLRAMRPVLEAQSRLYAAELVAVMELLETHSIVAVPFKGPAFAARVGGEVTRECDDLDILVRGDDLGRVVRLLESHGYARRETIPDSMLPRLRRVSHEISLFRGGRTFHLELHWRLGPAWHMDMLDEARLFAALQASHLLGREVHAPRAEHLLLMHVADGMKGPSPHARWLADLAAILRHGEPLDWAVVRAHARAGRGLNILRVAIAALRAAAFSTPRVREATEVDAWLSPEAHAMADEAARSPLLKRVAESLATRCIEARPSPRASHSLLWSIAVSDRRLATAAHVIRYLSGPAVSDLAALPPGREVANWRLRGSSLGRRLRSVAAAHLVDR